MTPRTQGRSDAGVLLTYSEELMTLPTKGALKCEAELVSVMLGLIWAPGFDP